MRCPQSRPATISCRQTMAMSKPSGGVAAGIGAAGGAGERRRLNVPIIDAHDQSPSAKYAGGRTVHQSGFGCSRAPKGFVTLPNRTRSNFCWHVGLTPRRRLRAMSASPRPERLGAFLPMQDDVGR